MKKWSVFALAALMSMSVYADKYCGRCVGNDKGDVTVTLGGGGIIFASKRQIDNAGIAFAALAYNLTDNWAVEALLGGFNTSLNNSDNRTVNGTLFALDALYRFIPQHALSPYVLAGVGVFGMNPNGTDANNEGNINIGVGAQYFVHPAVALRLEARDFYTLIGGKNDVMIDGGVSFLFDYY